MKLSDKQQERYSRHILLGEVGGRGQKKLLESKVLVIGAGGLGSPVLMYLAAAGVGTIGIIDHDRVDLSNLGRQIIHSTDDIGKLKTESAVETMKALNPDVRVIEHPSALEASNARRVIGDYDVVVDGSDNFATRYIVNDACVLEGKPNVHGSVLMFDGQATVFSYGDGPCYRCLYPSPPPPEFSPKCREAGVLGVVPGIIGMIQAAETVKLLIGIGEPLVGRLLVFSALGMDFNVVEVNRRADCPVCGRSPSITEPEGIVETCAAQPGAS